MTAWMVWSLLASTLVAIAAAAIDGLAASFRVPRRFVWLSAIVVAVVLPVGLAVRPAPHPASGAVTSAAPIASGPAASAQESQGLAPFSIDWSTLASIDPSLAPIWASASLFFALILARRLVGLRKLTRRCDRAETELGPVLVSRDAGPAVVGFLRPRIVLPRWVLSEEPWTRSLLLRHELEHVRARDTLLLLVGELAVAAFPWNAGVWWMVRRLAVAVEIDCDARVVRATGEPHAYGTMLLSITERRIGTLPMVSPPFAARASIEARIKAMTSPVRHRPISSSLACAAIVVVIVAAMACAPRPEPLLTSAPAQEASSPQFVSGNRPPRYPDTMRRDGVEGQVIVEFSAGPGGVPNSTSVRIVEATNELFAAAVRNIVPSWRLDGPGVVRVPVYFLIADPSEGAQGMRAMEKWENEPGPRKPIIVTAVR